MTTFIATDDERTSYKDPMVPPTNDECSGLQNYSDVDCPEKKKTSSHGPEELSHRGKMVYEKGLFYPMHIGDVFLARYLVLDKLGFGSKSNMKGLLSSTYANVIYSFLHSLDGSGYT